MISKWAILVVCTLLGSSQSAFVDTLSQCALKDHDCLKNLFQKLIIEYSSTGVPEYGVPPFDPFKIKDITIPILGLLNITIEDAEGVGVKTCIIDSFSCDIEKGLAKVGITCDIEAKGKFLVSGTNPISDHVYAGKNIHGNGNGEIKAEKLHMDLGFHYNLVRKENNEIYISPLLDQTEFSYDMQNFHISADNIFIGEEDVSEQFVSYINENWKTILKLFGKTIFDQILKYLQEILTKLVDSVPITKVLSGDISSYVKN
ncbi:unnamed protein product [Danaus chrysippus]|uniref:(African queen) hypothetical protein n=1 Tax=Danaus chrysippus TaxID=151541 RepID=A0A8J2W0J8_9NEOP|nr:unnamed protein product [Danaus chrysippus]